jgi:hypothetical protein
VIALGPMVGDCANASVGKDGMYSRGPSANYGLMCGCVINVWVCFELGFSYAYTAPDVSTYNVAGTNNNSNNARNNKSPNQFCI